MTNKYQPIQPEMIRREIARCAAQIIGIKSALGDFYDGLMVELRSSAIFISYRDRSAKIDIESDALCWSLDDFSARYCTNAPWLLFESHSDEFA